MGLFKSREERRIEREIAARSALANFRRQIALQEKHEKDYLKKAVRAKQLGDEQMLSALKSQIRRTHLMRYRFERNLLVLETAVQAKDQIESFEAFGKAMGAVSKSIEQAYGVTDLVNTQKQYELAMGKAQSMEKRIDIFLETTMQTADVAGEEESAATISDTDLDRLISEAATKSEHMDTEIAAGLKEIERELGKDK